MRESRAPGIYQTRVAALPLGPATRHRSCAVQTLKIWKVRGSMRCSVRSSELLARACPCGFHASAEMPLRCGSSCVVEGGVGVEGGVR